MAGYMKLSRDILNWEWYDDPNTFRVFFHLLLNANYTDKQYQGLTIKKGEVVVGRHTLAQQIGLSERNVRTALNHLKSTNEVTIKTTNKYSVVTICNFDSWQGAESECDQQKDQQNDQRPTSDRPASDQQLTTPKEIKKERNKERKEEEIIIPPTPQGGMEELSAELERIKKEMSKLKEDYSALQSENEKLKKKRKKDESFDVRADLSYVGDEYSEKWKEWLDYKDSINKQYKTQSGAEKAYAKWLNMSNGSIKKANAIVDNAQIHSWEGMYDIKDWVEPANEELPLFPANPRHGDCVGYDWFYDMTEGRWIKDGEMNTRGEIFNVQAGRWLK